MGKKKKYKQQLRELENRSFDFLNAKGRRRDHGSQIQPLSVEMDQTGRDKGTVLGRDLYHDSSLFKWAVDFHCKNTTGFVFQPMSKDKGFNRALEQFYDHFNRTLDFYGRHTFEDLREKWEARAVIDGDVLLARVNNGQVQTFQSDWIRSDDKDGFIQGVKTDEFGRPIGYQIERDTTLGKKIKTFIPKRHAVLIAYYDGRMDSYRGVSPLVSSFPIFQDLLDIEQFMTAKIKMEASMGIFLKKSKNGSPFTFSAPELPVSDSGAGGSGDPGVIGHVDGNGDYTEYEKQSRRRWDFSGGGIKGFELEDGEDIAQVGNNSPGSTYKDYFLTELQVALKPLSIPLTIYQENLSNYYCSRAAYGLYQFQTLNRVKFNKTLYTNLFVWRLALASLDGTFPLPTGMLAADVPFGFVQEEHSVLDMDKEMKGHGSGVQFGFVSPQSVCGKMGRDYYQTIDEIAAAADYARQKGVSLSWLTDSGTPGANEQIEQMSQELKQQRELLEEQIWGFNSTR